MQQLVVAGLDRDVHGARGEVVRPHRVPAQHVGVAHRHVVLVVRAAPLDVAKRALAVPLDEQAGLLEVARLSERAAELRQAHLDLGVAADALVAALAEDLAHEVGGATGDVDQSVVGVGTRAHAGDRRLEEVAEAVQLVAPLEVGPARALARPPEPRVEVAVGLLGRRDPRDDRAEPRLELVRRQAGGRAAPISHAIASRYL